MIQPIHVEPRLGYRIRIRYADGLAGEIDLSGLTGRGVFQAWNYPGRFEKVYLAPRRSIAWDDNFELCSDALYSELTGKPLEAVMTEACRGSSIL